MIRVHGGRAIEPLSCCHARTVPGYCYWLQVALTVALFLEQAKRLKVGAAKCGSRAKTGALNRSKLMYTEDGKTVPRRIKSPRQILNTVFKQRTALINTGSCEEAKGHHCCRTQYHGFPSGGQGPLFGPIPLVGTDAEVHVERQRLLLARFFTYQKDVVVVVHC